MDREDRGRRHCDVTRKRTGGRPSGRLGLMGFRVLFPFTLNLIWGLNGELARAGFEWLNGFVWIGLDCGLILV